MTTPTANSLKKVAHAPARGHSRVCTTRLAAQGSLSFLFLSWAVLLLLAMAPAHAQPPAPTFFQYAVKFICGPSPGDILAPGTYFTAINVHNPTRKGISFQKKFAIALPNEQPGSSTV